MTRRVGAAWPSVDGPRDSVSKIFRKRGELLLDLAQCAAEAVAEYMKRPLGADARPGIVVSTASAGDLVQWHPHGDLLVTRGAFSDDDDGYELGLAVQAETDDGALDAQQDAVGLLEEGVVH